MHSRRPFPFSSATPASPPQPASVPNIPCGPARSEGKVAALAIDQDGGLAYEFECGWHVEIGEFLETDADLADGNLAEPGGGGLSEILSVAVAADVKAFSKKGQSLLFNQTPAAPLQVKK